MAFYWPHHCIDALLASFLDRLKYEFFLNVSLSIYVSSWKQIKHILLQVNLVICIPYKTTKQQAHGHSAREPVIKMERDGQWHCLETREETLENYKVYHCYCFCHVITITSSKCWIVFWYFFRSVINNANAYTCWHERSADGLLKLKRIFLNSFDKSLYVMKIYVRSYYISFWVSREGKVAAKRDFIKDIINWFFLILLNTSDSKMQFLLFICFAFFNCFFLRTSSLLWVKWTPWVRWRSSVVCEEITARFQNEVGKWRHHTINESAWLYQKAVLTGKII